MDRDWELGNVLTGNAHADEIVQGCTGDCLGIVVGMAHDDQVSD